MTSTPALVVNKLAHYVPNAMIVPVNHPTWLQRWLRRLRGRKS